jgi:hypothetical protein
MFWLSTYLLLSIHHEHHVIPLCIHDIYLVYMHAIGVPKGVTLLEFEKNPEEQTSE